jgi:hypothetical protein
MQKRACAGVATPHCGQLRASLLPHAMQNCAAAGLSTAQLGHVSVCDMFTVNDDA